MRRQCHTETAPLPHFSVRLDDDLAARFDAVAAGRGGRSRLLRRVIEDAAAAEAGGPSVALRGWPTSAKLTLRLTETDRAALEREARRAGLSRTQWAVALLRRRLHDRPQLTPPSAQAFIGVQRELRRIGVNVNQIARALNAAVLPGRVLDLEIAQMDGLGDQIRHELRGLRAAFEGDLGYWDAAA